jgi:hypothetical protein
VRHVVDSVLEGWPEDLILEQKRILVWFEVRTWSTDTYTSIVPSQGMQLAPNTVRTFCCYVKPVYRLIASYSFTKLERVLLVWCCLSRISRWMSRVVSESHWKYGCICINRLNDLR